MKSEDLERARQAWRLYVETGRVARELLRERTYLSWLRCQSLGTNPRSLAERRLSSASTAALVESSEVLIRAARPYLHALSLAVGGEQHAALLGDAGGVVLDVVGDAQTMLAIQAGTFPGPGTLMSEAAAGSNGIGTALAEEDYVEVIGPEHFVRSLDSLTCQGVPVRGPRKAVVGVLSITARSLQVAERAREILLSAVSGIEAELSREVVKADVATSLVDSALTVPCADELRQDLTQLPAAARLRLDAAAQIARQNRPEDALSLILSADDLVRRFNTQAETWREIAQQGPGSPTLIDLNESLGNMIDLFETEASIRGVRFARAGPSRLVAYVDPRGWARLLFQAFLKELCGAPKGSRIGVELHAAEGNGEVTLAFSTGHELKVPSMASERDEAG